MPFDINAQIEDWRKLLLDTSKRNRLINFKTGRTGGISLVYPDSGEFWHHLVTNNTALSFVWKRDLIDLPPESEEGTGGNFVSLFDPPKAPQEETSRDILERCRQSPHLRPDHLLTDLPDRQLATRITRLALNSQEALTEQGVTILFVAFGFLRWFESPESEVEVRSPLLLVPVRLERESVQARWKLQAEDEDILPNHSLAQRLASDFRLRLPVPEDEPVDGDDPNWRTRYFGEVERCVRDQPRWEVLDEVALGTFGFQKLAMWGDLDRNRDRIAKHDLCRAIAGDRTVELRWPPDLPKAEELDRITHPAQTFHILDADSSQHEAIAAATRGASLVLDGPPGTGKSQTIANVIAEFLAAGKTVLFVSEKAAALEVVQRRLQDKGLADFCLACHSHKANKREVVTELSRSLSLGPESFCDPADDLQRLHETRHRLNEYVRELRTVRPPLGMTAYQVHGELSRLSHLESKSRCPVPQVLERNAAYLRGVVDLLAGLPDCRSVIEGRDRHPWRGCRTPVYSQILRNDICHHFGELEACLGRITEAAAALHQLGFCVGRPTRSQWRGAVEIARAVLACPPVPASWFQGDPKSVAEAVVQIDHLSQACRRARSSLPEFATEALRRAEADSLSALDMPPDGTGLSPQPGETVGALRQRLRNAGITLRELLTRALAVDQSVQEVARLLRVSVSSTPVKALPRLAELAEVAARMGPVRRSWWEAGRRKELQGVFARCQAETRAAQEVRAELAARLSPRAFAPESTELAASAERFRFFLARLLPGWWAFKAEASRWYTSEAPKTASLLDDLGRLAAYHRRMDYCREVQEHYAADLLLDGEGKPDWDGTLDALRSLDRMEQLIPKIPANLQADLSTENGLDRPGLVATARALAERIASLRQYMEAAKECDLREVTDGAPGKVRLSARALMTWLETRSGTVARQTAFFEQVSALLAEGRDLAVADLAGKVRTLNALGNFRTQLAGLCSRVWPGQATPAGVEDRERSALSSGAEALLRLLERWHGSLPAQVVRVLTTPEIRERLTSAVRQNDAACAGGFDQSWQFLAGLFDLSQPVSTGLTIESTPLADMRPWLAERVGDAHRLREWTQFCEIEREVTRAGITPILDEVLAGRVKPDEAGKAFRARFFGLWLDALYERVPTLRQFATESHERLIEQFRELDRCAVASARARIRSLQLSRPDRPRPVAGEAPGSSELGLLLREANKKRRHLPLRRLRDYESVLDVCCTLGLPRRRLRWHYRSRREGLIAFSNHFFYGNELVTFPSVHDVVSNPAVAFEYVPNGRWKAGASNGFNAVEARRTAELVLEHFQQLPGESLGVIAFNQRQQMRILDELEQLRKANPDLEQFFSLDRDEPFFVKNLENVQGDERDVIFLGIGYGPDETGRVAMRFGPLNRPGGERRLNVAVTRARQRMTVVSSMHAHDIDLSCTGATGAKLLRDYLDYAERGTEALTGAITEAGEHGFDSPFEQEVYEELTRRGLTIHPQVGCSGFRIDLAVVDPQAPGRYLLGVECDGATYHSSATARDRDRLRQEVLESLGWRICRIWSTDWLRDYESQVRRVQAAMEKAQQDRDFIPTTVALPRAPQPPQDSPVKSAVAAPANVTLAVRNYDSIDEVPDSVLRRALCNSLQAFGATRADDLIQAVTRQLGFGRTGKRIQARIEQCIEALIHAGEICRATDERLQLARPSQAASK
jgi:very-short-patch-repair endonuclease